jgi:hypothetical protein
MADPVLTIRAALNGDGPATWPDLVAAIAELAASASDAGEQALVDLLSDPRPLALAGGYVPHSQSPLDMIQTAAIDALWQTTGDKHADVCRQVAAATDSPIVKRIVRARFGL